MAIITTGLLLVLATWLVELVVLRIVLQKEMSRRQNFDLFLINLLTNPTANWLYQSGELSFIQVESLVVLLESWPLTIVFQVSYKKGLYLSILANSASALAGYFCFTAFY